MSCFFSVDLHFQQLLLVKFCSVSCGNYCEGGSNHALNYNQITKCQKNIICSLKCLYLALAIGLWLDVQELSDINHPHITLKKGSNDVNQWIMCPKYMYVNLTWTRTHFANEDRFRLLSLTFSDGVVARFANHLPLLNPFVTGHRTLPHTHTQTHANTF